jgi:hypothetical protein
MQYGVSFVKEERKSDHERHKTNPELPAEIP